VTSRRDHLQFLSVVNKISKVLNIWSRSAFSLVQQTYAYMPIKLLCLMLVIIVQHSPDGATV